MAYKHGVYVQEQATALIAPVLGTAGLQVVVGTAPVNMLADPEAACNTPLLVQSYSEAVAAVGYHSDFAAYTLCESIAVNFQVVSTGPLVFINVLSPSKHSAAIEEQEIAVEEGVALLDVTGVLPATLVVKNGETELKADEDYTTAWNDDGTMNIVLLVDAETVTVSGKRLDPGLVTYEDIIGGVDVNTGKETGMEVIRQVYPKLGMTPGILLAPRWSANPNVAAALQAKTKEINGVFKAVAFIDIDSTATGATKYTDVKEQKEQQAVTDPNAYAVWGYGKLGDVVYSGSALAASLTAYTDAVNGDVPNVSPSNKTLSIGGVCLADGTEVMLDQTQANTINGFGVATFLNMNGFRLWGNNTACYPGNTDPKDRWLSVRRFFCWTGNTFILTYFQKVDDPMNPRLIEAIVDSENVRGNSFVARDICARYEITFVEDENPTTDLLNGKITFHQYLTPYVPAEDIENILEFDADALSALFS
jgi:hypothetical protein